VNAKKTPLRALVTGASSGIGAATVHALVASGWSVVGFARRADRLAALQEETGCEIFVGDVTNEDDVSGLAEFVRNSGGVSVVVNNAGLAVGVDPVATASSDDWATCLK
jgi:NADP-dependent 3-hydroxy acid dehydrogenase YdfG